MIKKRQTMIKREREYNSGRNNSFHAGSKPTSLNIFYGYSYMDLRVDYNY